MWCRIRYTKVGKVRWVGHRDTAHMIERALRRIGAPVIYSEGFTSRPRLSFGLALPMGCESIGEYVDVDVSSSIVGREIEFSEALPVGCMVGRIVDVDGDSPSIQQDVDHCRWLLDLQQSPDVATLAVARFVAADQHFIARERKGVASSDDLRANVAAIEVLGTSHDGAGAMIAVTLVMKPKGARPTDLVAALSPTAPLRRALRTHQLVERAGERVELLPLSDSPTAPAPAGV